MLLDDIKLFVFLLQGSFERPFLFDQQSIQPLYFGIILLKSLFHTLQNVLIIFIFILKLNLTRKALGSDPFLAVIMCPSCQLHIHQSL